MLKIKLSSYNLMGDTLKKIFEVIGLFSLACFSFFYTSQISSVIKENNDIYKEIKDMSLQYKNESIDAKISGDDIIPGVSGSVIDIDKSYKKMEKINSFNSNLLVYKKVKPNISIDDIYDKYIISGNKNKKEVSLIFLVNDNDNIDAIINFLNEEDIKATFFVDGFWFEKNNELIIDLIDNDHIVGNLGYNYSYDDDGINWINAIVSKIANQNDTYCYNEIDNEENLNICNKNKSYTIRPNIITKKSPLIEIKQDLKSGSIIALQANYTTISELPLIVEYINSRDLEIVNIEKLIRE